MLRLFTPIGDVMADPLEEAETRVRALQTYQVTLHATGADGERQVMRYFYRKPGWVRIECVDPHHGVVLIYDPATRRARVWPLGLGSVPVLSLAPDNRLIRSPRGHHIDRSDVGALLESLRALGERGSVSSLEDAIVSGRTAVGFEIVAAAGVAVDGVHRNRVWLAHDTLFPLRVESFGSGDELIETVELVDAELDVRFPEGFFTP